MALWLLNSPFQASYFPSQEKIPPKETGPARSQGVNLYIKNLAPRHKDFFGAKMGRLTINGGEFHEE